MTPWRFRLRRRRAASQRAVVMILSLWIVVVLSILASSLAFDVQVNSKLALLQKQQFIAYYLARSAVAVGMTNLQNDRLIDFQENPNQQYDALSDVWAQPDLKEKDREIKLGKGTYQCEVADEEGKININRATPRLLKAIFEYYGYEPPESDDIANAIYDFKDADDKVSNQAGGADAQKASAAASATGTEKENEYYDSLGSAREKRTKTAEAPTYICANEDLLTIEELLDIYGVDPKTFYGYDPESEEAKEEKVRNDIALGKHVTERKKTSKKKKELPLNEILTVDGNNRINLNTASEEVLTILMYAGSNCKDLPTAEAAANNIAEYRGTAHKGKSGDADQAFHSLPDVAKVPGLNQQAVMSLSQGAVGINIGWLSDHYAITGIGRLGNVKKTIKVIVERKLDQYNPDDASLVNKKSGGARGSFASRGGVRKKSSSGKEEDNFIRIPAIRVKKWVE